MTDDEAAQVWDLMLDIWPHREPTDGMAAIWIAELVRHDRESVLHTLEQLKRTEEWFPSVAKVLEGIRLYQHNRQLEQRSAQQRRELASPAIGRDEALAKLEELKARRPLGSRPVIDPKWKGIPRKKRSKFVPPPCTEPDCSTCGTGPVVDRGGYDKSEVPG